MLHFHHDGYAWGWSNGTRVHIFRLRNGKPMHTTLCGQLLQQRYEDDVAAEHLCQLCKLGAERRNIAIVEKHHP